MSFVSAFAACSASCAVKKFYNVNAEAIVKTKPGLRGKGANTVMMVAYFKVSGIVPFEDAAKEMKMLNAKTFAKKGQAVIDMNNELVDAAADACVKVKVPMNAPCPPWNSSTSFWTPCRQPPV